MPDALRPFSACPRVVLARLIGAVALLAVLCLPALHAAHLRLAEIDAHVAVDPHAEVDPHAALDPHVDAHAAGHDHPSAPAPRHDAAHCAICVSAQSLHAGATLLGAADLCAFDAPAPFPPVLYVAPPADAFVPVVAVPRGPPARA